MSPLWLVFSAQMALAINLGTSTEATLDQVTDLESAVLAKYNVEVPSQPLANTHAAHVVQPTILDEAKAEEQSPGLVPGWHLEAAYHSKHNMDHHSDEASYFEGDLLSQLAPPLLDESQDGALVQSRRLKLQTQTQVSHEVTDLESAVLAKYNVEVPSQPLTNTHAAHVAQPTSDPVDSNSKAGLRLQSRQPPAETTELEATVMSKLTFKKPLDEARSEESSEQLRMPEPTLSSAEDEAAAEMAERRAEVEDVFHIKPKEQAAHATESVEERIEIEDARYLSEVQDVDAEEATSAAYKLLRFGCLLIAVLSLVAVGYHKYDSICSMCDDRRRLSKFKAGLPKFKAKQEDKDPEGCGFAAPPRFSKHAHGERSWPSAEGVLTSFTSIVDSGRRGLSRRARAESSSSCDYSV